MNYNKTTGSKFQITFPQMKEREFLTSSVQQGCVILLSKGKRTLSVHPDFGATSSLGNLWDESKTQWVLGYFDGSYTEANEFAKQHFLPNLGRLSAKAEEDERFALTK